MVSYQNVLQKFPEKLKQIWRVFASDRPIHVHPQAQDEQAVASGGLKKSDEAGGSAANATPSTGSSSKKSHDLSPHAVGVPSDLPRHPTLLVRETDVGKELRMNYPVLKLQCPYNTLEALCTRPPSHTIHSRLFVLGPYAVESPHDIALQGYESGATRIIDGMSEDGEASHAAAICLVPLGKGPAGEDEGWQGKVGACESNRVDDSKQGVLGKSRVGRPQGVPKLAIGEAIGYSMGEEEEEAREVGEGKRVDGDGPGLKWLREKACETDEESSSSSASVTESTTPTSQKPGPSTTFSSRKKIPTSQPAPTSPPTSFSPPGDRGTFSPPTPPLGDETPSKASTTPTHLNSARPSLSADPMSLLLSPPPQPPRPPTHPPKRGHHVPPRPEAPQPEPASRRISLNGPPQPGQIRDVPRQPRSPPTSGGSSSLTPDQAAAAADGGGDVGGIIAGSGGGGSGRLKRQSSSSRRFSPPNSRANPPPECDTRRPCL